MGFEGSGIAIELSPAGGGERVGSGLYRPELEQAAGSKTGVPGGRCQGAGGERRMASMDA